MTIIIEENYHGIIQLDIRVAISVCVKLLLKVRWGLLIFDYLFNDCSK